MGVDCAGRALARHNRTEQADVRDVSTPLSNGSVGSLPSKQRIDDAVVCSKQTACNVHKE